MVQTDMTQLSAECSEWRKHLRELRESLIQSKEQLQEIVSQTHSKEGLVQVEHYHNQFHIQLINVHDLKHAIKEHEKKMLVEKGQKGKVTMESFAKHEDLLNQYQQLQSIVEQLVHDFARFLRRKK